MNAVRVFLYRPEWNIPCGVCETYLYRADGSCMRDAAGVPQPRGTLPTPCGTCPKVPRALRDAYPDDVKRLRAAAHELTPANRKFWEFYLRCKAVGWTNGAGSDPLVQFMAGGLREVEDAQARDAADRTHAVTAALLELALRRIR